jgi:serine/threonine protein kinase
VAYSKCLLHGTGAKQDVQAADDILVNVGQLGVADRWPEVQLLDRFLKVETFVRPFGFDDLSDRFLNLEMAFSSDAFVAKKVLHGGPFGLIRKMQHRDSGRMMAVKLFSPAFATISNAVWRHFFREFSALHDLKHPCVMEMVGFELPQDAKGIAIAYEFMKNGSLLDVLTRVQAGNVPPFWTPTGRATSVMDLVLGMRFIHSRGAIHRNLKPSNLFITDDGHLRIGDLTWCRFSNGKYELTKQPGRPHYQAPEIYESDNYSEKIDVFAFGSILYEILSLHPVFSPDLLHHRVMAKLVSRDWAPPPDDWPPPVRTLLNDCWRRNPAQRPSFDDIAEFLADSHFCIRLGVEPEAVRVFVQEVAAMAEVPYD